MLRATLMRCSNFRVFFVVSMCLLARKIRTRQLGWALRAGATIRSRLRHRNWRLALFVSRIRPVFSCSSSRVHFREHRWEVSSMLRMLRAILVRCTIFPLAFRCQHLPSPTRDSYAMVGLCCVVGTEATTASRLHNRNRGLVSFASRMCLVLFVATCFFRK